MIKMSSQISGEKIDILVSNIGIIGQSHEKGKNVSISSTIYQDRFQMHKTFKCEKIKTQVLDKNMSEFHYNLALEKNFLIIQKNYKEILNYKKEKKKQKTFAWEKIPKAKGRKSNWEKVSSLYNNK